MRLPSFMHKQTFDREKAVEAIKYIAKNTPNPDIYWVLKIIYHANKYHLERYGRLIFGDSFVALRYGPVPSGSYDLLKDARNFRGMPEYHPAIGEFEVHGKNRVVALQEANLDVFSDSDLHCLDRAIQKFGPMPFKELCDASHD